ncbi:MAG: NADH-quinone oxidoreductase subunit L [Chloroflexi bacterium]|nr:NADH-quinone oxidoreductase subunit L [Chloroflexota bacterium]
MPELAIWSIIGAPLASFLLIGLGVRPAFGPRQASAGYLTILAIAYSLGMSLWVLAETLGAEGHRLALPTHEVLSAGGFSLEVGLLVDGLTAVMLIIVTAVSLLVQVYSQGYMHGDSGYTRYFSYMSLFTASMLLLVLANNLVLLYVGWEMVGLCSYLLIGHWFHRPSAAAAAKKAFIVTRFGDFFFLLAIIFLFTQTGALVISDSAGEADVYGVVGKTLTGAALTWVALGIFAGAVGKSAQFPLHTWLPDAMEGPTPVSALIHAATMVAAGVFLVARFFPLIHAADTAITIVAVIGAFTAVFAASMGMVMKDIKRVLAYSTISQLGYMMMGLGVGAYAPAMFHLFNHAFFKALLFLGSGSVNHATGTFDMRLMGGLRKAMPWTWGVFLVGSLSLAGIPPFSGFFSKDEILGAAWHRGDTLGQFVFWMGLAGVFMTAFYVFRALFMTFHGEYKGGEVGAHGEARHPHESPRVMVLPMVILAVASIVSWVANAPGQNQLAGLLGYEGEEVQTFPLALSLIAALAGIGVATGMYLFRALSAEGVSRATRPLYTLVARKYFFDELYEDVLVRRVFYRGLAAAMDRFDRTVVDGTVDMVGLVGRNAGRVLVRAQTGQLQFYGVVLSLGVLAILAAFLLWGR